MQLWTQCPIKVERLYGDDRARVTIPDKQHARDWRHESQEFEGKYVALLAAFKPQFIIMFASLDNGEISEEWLASTFRNGLAIQYPFPAVHYPDEKPHEPQVHVYPLVMLPWFQKKYRQEKKEDDPIMFVDGKIVKWTKDVCFTCPQMLDRSMRQCSAVHESCTNPLVSEKDPPSKEWFEAHATVTSDIAGFSYRAIEDMALIKPFEPFTIYGLTSNEAAIEKQKEKRSNSAAIAAQSRFVQKVACKQCMLKGWCGDFRRGGSWCKGLRLAEDYDYLHKKCEPWMTHVMLLTQHEPIDAKLISSWKGTRTPAYVLRPALETPFLNPAWHVRFKDDLRSVVMMRGCHGNPSTVMPYLYVCELLNVKSISEWNELPPSYKTSRSLRAVAYGLASGRIRSHVDIKAGWGSRSVEIVGIDFEAGKSVTMHYDNNRHNSGDRYRVNDTETLHHDLLALPGIRARDGASLPEGRLVENAIFHEAVINRRLNLTIDEVKKARRIFAVQSVKVNTHPSDMYAWLKERSKERCRQKRRSSKQPASLTPGETIIAT